LFCLTTTLLLTLAWLALRLSLTPRKQRSGVKKESSHSHRALGSCQGQWLRAQWLHLTASGGGACATHTKSQAQPPTHTKQQTPETLSS